MSARMRLTTFLGEVLPVFGTVGLLSLWLFQQTGIESRAGELRNIAAARTVYQTYQSHNALFNAVNEALANAPATARLRTSQTYNYELGLAAIERVLPEDLKKDVPPKLGAFDGTATFEAKMARTQERLELLQSKLSAYEASVRAASAADHTMYLWLYMSISALSIGGALCRFFDKIRPAA